MKKVYISTSTFGQDDQKPLQLLKEADLQVGLNPFGRKMTEDEVIAALADVDYLIAGTETLSRRVLESSKKLRMISRCGVGMDNVDIAAARDLGIPVLNTPYGPTVAVAELTIGFIIDLLRRISMTDRAVRASIWKKQMGNLLQGKKVGIIGYGRIGRKVAELLKPFQAEIAFYDIQQTVPPLPGMRSSMDDVLAWADIVTLHCSATDGKPVLGPSEFQKMRQGAWVINVSRGGLIDEEALYHALKQNHLAGAALDVYRSEPYAGPLRELENVVLTSHIGSYARESRIEMEVQSVLNLLKQMKA